MSNKKMVKAKEILEEISQDEHERYLAELREKYILDQNATEAAGYDKGLKNGIKQGIEQQNLEIAKKMLKQNFTLEVINSITKIPIDDLKIYRKNFNFIFII